MKNKRLYKILSVVIVVLFTLTIICGIIWGSLKNRPQTASADSLSRATDTVNVWENYSNTRVWLSGTYVFQDSFLRLDYERWGTNGYNIIDYNGWFEFPFLINVERNDIVSGYYCKYFYFVADNVDNTVLIGYDIYSLDGDNEFWEEDVYSHGAWRSDDYRAITLNCFVPTSFKMFLEEFSTQSYVKDIYQSGYEDGYGKGYNVGYDYGYQIGYDEASEEGGYQIGYDDGYDIGYDKGYNEGISKQLVNPVSFFLDPVSQFMNTKLFGELSIGSAFNVALFVLVAVMFVKMFAGG
ncbi:MAG: hypothetical protein HDQ88_11690 [Clostridia bacterium]|nr:hypothetical protein [Clostridia bacterium]